MAGNEQTKYNQAVYALFCVIEPFNSMTCKKNGGTSQRGYGLSTNVISVSLKYEAGCKTDT
jgi:hypothetical protein